MMGVVPDDLPQKYRWMWHHPWTQRARSHPGFRRWLLTHGRLSPHFTRDDARCKCGAPVPSGRLLLNAQNHAFNLEQLRHELGDNPIPHPLSWYRPDWYNHQIGGAVGSQHIQATATDFTREWVESIGRTRFDRAADKVFRNGGFGRYPSGSVHVDSRGFRARWTSF